MKCLAASANRPCLRLPESMADILSPSDRSRLMSRIRGRDTGLEVRVRRVLHSLGFRYRLGSRDVPGKPDLVLARYRAAIFVHGCFWHGHDCVLFRVPKTRPAFWKQKIEGNRARDQTVAKQIAARGWRQCVVWECSVRGLGDVALESVGRRIAIWLSGPASELTIRGSQVGIN